MAETPPAGPLRGIHHNAFRCRDAVQMRWFYEDVLGLMAAADKAAQQHHVIAGAEHYLTGQPDTAKEGVRLFADWLKAAF